ncbi:collagen-like triple helix repeat-containing protein [Niabella terrae]
MKQLNCRPIIYLLVCALSLISCAKDGKDGIDGVDGEDGAPGATGPRGATGTANVQYSDWFNPTTYTNTSVFGIVHFRYEKAAPAITQAILDKGVVLVYGKIEGYNPLIWPKDQVGLLPISLLIRQGSTPYTDVITYLLTPGKLTIDFSSSINAYGTISSAHHFRYVIIPGGVAAKRVTDTENRVVLNNGSIVSESELKSMPYSKVCELLDITP